MIKIIPLRKNTNNQGFGNNNNNGEVRKGIKLIIIIFLIILLYNIIEPNINNTYFSRNNIIPTNVKLFFNPDYNKNAVYNYLPKSSIATNKLNEINKKIDNHRNGIEYSTEERIIDINELNTIKENLYTDNNILIEIYNYNIELINIIEDIIINIDNKEYYSMENYNEITSKERQLIIELLEEYYIPYEILDNNDIRYWITY